MDRMPIQSSHLKSVGYKNGVLEVEFKNGQVYQGECEREHYENLIAAESAGKYFNALKNTVAFTKVPDENQRTP